MPKCCPLGLRFGMKWRPRAAEAESCLLLRRRTHIEGMRSPTVHRRRPAGSTGVSSKLAHRHGRQARWPCYSIIVAAQVSKAVKQMYAAEFKRSI